MQLASVENLPIIETEPSADWALVSHQVNELQLNYLAYAVKRDFLSTPRTYAILDLTGHQQEPVRISEHLVEVYLDKKKIITKALESGFYRNDEQNNSLLLVINSQLFEIECKQFKHIETLYYCLDSRTALEDHISSL